MLRIAYRSDTNYGVEIDFGPVYSYGLQYAHKKFAPLPLLDMLAAAHHILGSDCRNQVLYTPPSLMAAKSFLKNNVLGKAILSTVRP